MKKVIFILILILGFQFVQGQTFQKSKKYTVTPDNKKIKNSPYTLNLVRAENASEKLFTFTIEDTELFEEVFISTIENPGLEGVAEVIKMEIEYFACCAHVEAYYFLVTDQNELVALSQLENVYCEGTNADVQYIFPNQKHGMANNILKAEVFYTKSSDIKHITSQESLVWNDNIYNHPNTMAITSF